MFALIAFLIAWTYAWAPREFRVRATAPGPTDFYHEYADAILAGQLFLARQPDPRLATLTDPYDPVTNAPYRVNDLSYANGRYYLYHGIVPAAILLAPFRAITGDHLSLVWASWLFGVLGAAASIAVALDFRKTFTPRASFAVTVGGLAALVLAQGAHGVLRDGNLNQLPIASAYSFAMIAFWAVWKGRPGSRAPAWWLTLASLSAGLAVGSRPNYIFAVSALLGLTGLAHLRANPSISRRAGLIIAAGLPLALCVAGILALNQTRFGDPFEFGMRSMLGAWNQRELPSLAWTSVWSNLYHYLWAPGIYSTHFPFVTAPSWQAIGVLWHAPVIWLVVLSLGLMRSGSNPLHAFAVPLAGFAVVNFAVLILLPSGNQAAAPTSANVRYLLDWQPAWVLLAVIAAFSTSHAIAAKTRQYRLFSVFVFALGGASALAGLSLDLGRYPLVTIRTAARWLSLPAWWAEGVSQPKYGPIAIDLRFPADRTGTREPLLAIGNQFHGDLVYVIYDSSRSLRFALVSVERPGPVSAPISIDVKLPHRLELHAGPLNPPVSHPRFSSFSDDGVAYISRRLVIRLDGQTVMDVPVAFSAPAGAPAEVGRTSFLRDYATETFSGQILGTTRIEMAELTPESDAAANYGPVRLRVRFPEAMTSGAEPLLTTGQPRAGDVVYVAYAGDGTVRFGLDHWGHRGLLGEPIAVDRSVPHEIVIEMGSLYPDERSSSLALRSADERRRLKQRVTVWMDGQPVLEGDQATYESSPYDVHVGVNPIGASSCGYELTGEILAVERPASERL